MGDRGRSLCYFCNKILGFYVKRKFHSTGSWNRLVNLTYNNFEWKKEETRKTPLIIAHGLFGSKKNWDSLAKAISRTGRRVITVDMRNHGDAPHVPDLNYHLMAEDIQLLMQDLGLEHAVMLGHSMGGKAAMTLALTHPNLVERLIVEDISPTVSPTLQMQSYLARMREVEFDNTLTMAAMRKSVDAQLQPVVKDLGVRQFLITNVVDRQDGYTWKVNLDSLKENIHTIMDFPHFLSTCPGPTLFIRGSRSPHIREKSHAKIHRLFPASRIVTVEGAGHWVHSEKPRQFLNIIIPFLDEGDAT